MSQIMKVFTGVFLVLLLMTTSAGVLGSFAQIMRAQNTHASMIDELENSNYASSVMQACFQAAEKENYQLQLSLYLENGDVMICTHKEEIRELKSKIRMAEVVLNYTIEFAFFEIKVDQQLFGYAR